MAVNKDVLELFYSISNQWTLRDQRLLAAIGVEFELCEYAFDSLYDYCLNETDCELEKWSAKSEDAARVTILARAFIDHALRLPKLVKILSKHGPSAVLADEFLQINEPLRRLRNALHHADERIEGGKSSENIQPIGGDFSWKTWTPIGSLDVYWISLGPLIVEQAGPTISTATSFKRSIDHLLYRAHDEEANLCAAFDDLCRLLERVHANISCSFDRQLAEFNIVRGSETDARSPAGMSGRMRIEGLELTQG